MTSYRYEVQVGGKWYPNNVCFATEAEASKAGYSKLCSWTLCEDYRVVPDDKPANYVWTDSGPRFLGDSNG